MWSGIVTGVPVAHPCQKCLKGISLASKNYKGSGGWLSWGNPHKDDKDAEKVIILKFILHTPKRYQIKKQQKINWH